MTTAPEAASGAPTDVLALQRRLRLRQYTPADHATVVELFIAGMQDYDGHKNDGNLRYIQWALGSDLADIHGTYIAPGGNYWIATLAHDDKSDTDSSTSNSNEEVVGMIAYQRKENGDGELRRLSIKREYRRFGLGKLLVAHLEQWAKTNGFTSVSLNTGTVMHDACRFYDKIGYALTKIEPTPGGYELAYFSKALSG